MMLPKIAIKNTCTDDELQPPSMPVGVCVCGGGVK